MTWCPLRLLRQALSHLRGRLKRGNKLHVYRFSHDHDFMQQALSDRLTFFQRELFQVLAEQVAQGLGRLQHLLPMDALMPLVRSQYRLDVGWYILRAAAALRCSCSGAFSNSSIVMMAGASLKTHSLAAR